jgi:ubiquinone/menaquinone biosynthesis C-methylase UbiE
MTVMLKRAAYHAQHASVRLPLFAVQQMLRVLSRRWDQPSRAEVKAVQDRYWRLLDRDLSNAELGLYPESLLFDFPMFEYAKTFPRLAVEFGRAIRRMRDADYKDLPDDVDLTRYPHYFRRNFHWQSDGYLSKRSAELYDAGVEFVFLGSADVMRRQIIPPISRFLAAHSGRARILDVATGTGRALFQLAKTHPSQKYYALDLSQYYLEVAQRAANDDLDISFVVENAEEMPFKDESFDVVTSVYLFHELPKNARRRVYREMHRVLRPGGLLVIEDSAQLSESKDISHVLERFPADLHEPFYQDYLRDDLAAGLAEAGFRIDAVEPTFVSKVVVARRE